MNARSWLYLLILTHAAVVSAAEQPTAPPADASNSSAVRFRRVYVPADRVKQWPSGAGRFLPMNADEFERQVRRLNRQRQGELPAEALIASAQYQARLQDDALVDGRATIECLPFPEGAPRLALEPCNLAIAALRLSGRGSAATATIGPDGRLLIPVEKAGRLEFDWSLRGRRTPRGALEFSWELPPAASIRLVLSLPKGLAPVCAGAIVGKTGSDNQTATWSVETGGRNRFVVRIGPQEEVSQRADGVRQTTIYDVSFRGVEITAQWTIDIAGTGLRQLPIEVGPGVQVIGARLGERPLAWSSVPGKSQVVLDFPEPLQGSGRTVRVAAVASVPLGRRWTLPELRPPSLFWEAGQATVIVHRPLAIEDIAARGARQIETASLPGDTGEALTFACHAPEAGIEVQIDRPPPTVRYELGTAIDWSRSQLAARITADLSASEGESYQCAADIGQHWTIDAIESVPPGAIDDWSQDSATGGRLSIRLKKALLPSQPLRLVLSAHAVGIGYGRASSYGVLEPLRFVGRAGRRVMAIQASPADRLELESAPRATLFDLAALAPGDADLLGRPSRGVAFEVGPATQDLRVNVQTQKPVFSAGIEVEAVAGAAAVQENYVLRIAPESADLERLVVRFSRRRAEPVQWTLELNEARDASERMALSGRLLSAQAGDDGEQWELTLPKPLGRPFVLRGQRTTTWIDPMPLSLAALPGARTQTGALLVLAADAAPVRIDDLRLATAPPRELAPDRANRVRGAYSYDPVRQTAAGAEPAVSLSLLGDASAPPGAWVWQLELQSRYEAEGNAWHRAVFRIESTGKQVATIGLPSGIARDDVLGVWLDQRKIAVDWEEDEAGKTRLRVSLPVENRFPSVSVQFRTREAALGCWARRGPPLPECDLPVLAAQWDVRVPPGYAVESSDSGRSTVVQRLFGAIAVPGGERSQIAAAASSEASRPAAAWAISPPAGEGVTDDQGWGHAVADLEDPGLLVTVCHRDTLRAFRWVAFLAFFGAVAWNGRRRPVLWVLLGGAAAIAAVVLPESLGAVPAGAFLGALAAFAYCLLRPVDGERDGTQRGSLGSTATLKTAILLGTIALCMAASAFGQTPPPAAHSVFIPVDGQGKPTGDKVYVPEEFFSLLQRASAVGEQRPDWMFLSGVYRGAMVAQPVPGQWSIDGLKATYEIQTSAPRVRARIALARQSVADQPGAVLLDGRTVEPQWSAQGEAFEVEIGEPGTTRLEIALRPDIRTQEDRSRTQCTIPPLPTARLELTVPRDAPAIAVPSSRGEVRRDEQHSLVTAQLGATRELGIEWSAGGTGAGPAIEVEQLAWLKLRPGGAVLDVRLHGKVLEGRLRRLELAADPNLQYRPGETGPQGFRSLRTTAGDPQTIELELPQPATEDFSVRLSFAVSDSSGPGRFRVPYLSVRGARDVHRWLAVSVDPALQWDQQGFERLQAVGTAQFLTAWGEATAEPNLAYRLPAAETAWSIATRPAPVKIAADQTLMVGFHENNAELALDAQTMVSGGATFQYRLQIPEGLEVERVAVEDDRPYTVRWVCRDRTMTVFLDGPGTGKQRVMVRGRVPLKSRSFPLPLIRLLVDEQRAFNLLLFRDPNVRASVAKAVGLTPAAPMPVDETTLGLGRLEQCFTAGSGAPQAEIALRSNRPQVRAEQITTLRPMGDGWEVEAAFHLVVRDGVVDELRILVPRDWPSGNRIDPPATLRTMELPGRGQKEIIVRPRAAIEGEHRFRIAAPLPMAPGEKPAVPRIELQDAETTTRLVVLPLRAQNQPLEWSTEGAAPAPLPADVASTVPRDSVAAFLVSGDPERIVLRSSGAVPDGREVLLADIRLDLGADRVRGLATFDLAGADGDPCVLQLPPDNRLIGARIDEIPVAAEPTAQAEWSIPLPPGTWPKRLCVVFDGPLPEASRAGERLFQVPLLVGLPVLKRLLTVQEQADARVDVVDASAISPLEEELARLESLTVAIERLSMVSAGGNGTQTRRFVPWMDRWNASSSRIARLVDQNAVAADPLASQIDALRRRYRTVLERVPSLKAVGDERREADPARTPWPESGEENLLHVKMEGLQDSVALTIEDRRPAPATWRGVLVLMTLTAIAAIGARRRIFAGVLGRWPQLVGIAIGAAWWAWLWPPIVGAAILLASGCLMLAAVARRRWTWAESRPLL